MIGIRVDANEYIASGHVMRCMSIACEIVKYGDKCIFITTDSNTETMIKDRGFDCICFEGYWNNLDLEIGKIAKLITELRIDKLLIDSYYATDTYFKELCKITKVIYIDDLYKIKHPIHMLINYGINVDKKYYEDVFCGQTKLFLGGDYVPLREEFKNIKPKFRNEVKKILITTGGSDPHNITKVILEKIVDNISFKEMEIIVVAGKMNTNIIELQQFAKKYNNVKLFQNTSKMSELMLESDIAITAGGTTMCELCACERPMVVFSFADNQIEGIKAFENKKAIIYVGDCRNNVSEVGCRIIEKLVDLINNIEYRKELTSNTKGIINKNGAEKIADIIRRL